MNGSEKTQPNFFDEKANTYRRYKWITLVFFIIFVLFGLVAFKNEITPENIRYLVKYIDFENGFSGASEGSTIYYDADSNNRFAIYHGDLAVANNGGITLFDSAGNITMSDSFSMSNPIIVAGGKYLVVYDLGGYYLKIYNSFSLLHEESFSYIIQSVAANDNGLICVATAEKSYHAALLVYNNDFEQVYKWLSVDKFITDCAIAPDDKILVSTVRAENGDLISELTALQIGKNEADYAIPLSEELPIALLPKRKSVLLLSDRALRNIREGEITKEALFDQDSIDLFTLGETVSAVAENELLVGVNYKVRVFDVDANEINSLNFSVQILDMKTFGDNIYILTRNEFYCLENGVETRVFEINGDYAQFEMLSSNTAVLCSDQAAQVLILE